MSKSNRTRRIISLVLSTINSVSDLDSNPMMSNTLTRRVVEKDYIINHHYIDFHKEYHTHLYNQSLEHRNHSVSNSLSISRKEQLMKRETEAQNQADIASARFLANYHRQNDRPYNTKVNYSLK